MPGCYEILAWDERGQRHKTRRMADTLVSAIMAGVSWGELQLAHRIEARLVDPYSDDDYPPRGCDRCGRVYRGGAVYCSQACAEMDA